MKTKLLLCTFVLTLFIGLQTTYAQRSVRREDCDFYHFLDSIKLEKSWYWTEDVGWEHINVKMCDIDYEIRFGCSCNSDVFGIYGLQAGEMISNEELSCLVESIKAAIANKTLLKAITPEGEIIYILICS